MPTRPEPGAARLPAAGIDLVHVPYPGSPQVNTAILTGQIAAGFLNPRFVSRYRFLNVGLLAAKGGQDLGIGHKGAKVGLRPVVVFIFPPLPEAHL